MKTLVLLRITVLIFLIFSILSCKTSPKDNEVELSFSNENITFEFDGYWQMPDNRIIFINKNISLIITQNEDTVSISTPIMFTYSDTQFYLQFDKDEYITFNYIVDSENMDVFCIINDIKWSNGNWKKLYDKKGWIETSDNLFVGYWENEEINEFGEKDILYILKGNIGYWIAYEQYYKFKRYANIRYDDDKPLEFYQILDGTFLRGNLRWRYSFEGNDIINVSPDNLSWYSKYVRK